MKVIFLLTFLFLLPFIVNSEEYIITNIITKDYIVVPIKPKLPKIRGELGENICKVEYTENFTTELIGFYNCDEIKINILQNNIDNIKVVYNKNDGKITKFKILIIVFLLLLMIFLIFNFVKRREMQKIETLKYQMVET